MSFMHKHFGTYLLLSLLTVAPLARAESVAGAKGDWPLWRGTPQHTGYQSLPGNITSPAVAWRQYIGGRVSNGGLFFSREAAGDILYAAPSGGLNSFYADGRTRWTRRYVQSSTILGVFDLEGDGRLSLIVAQTPFSRSSIDVFDAATGELIWSSPMHDGSIGSIKVADIDGDHVQEIVWAPANATFISAYRVRRFGPKGLVWSTTIADYISDPYTPSSLAIGDVTGDGLPDVVTAGGRGRISLMVFDGRGGALQGRTDATLPTGRTPESGGFHQQLALADIDGDGVRDLVMIGAWPQNSSFMFQGVITATWAKWNTPRVVDSYPYGMTFVDGSVGDFDHDGRADIVVSHFDEGRHSHTLMMLDARTLNVKAEIDGYLLAAIADADTPTPTFLGFTNATVEVPSGARDLGAVRFDRGVFQPLAWTRPHVTLPRSGNLLDPRPDVDNPGDRPVSVDVNGDGVRELVLENLLLVGEEPNQTGERTMQAVELSTGNVLRSFPAPFIASTTGVAQVGSGADTRFADAFNTGDVLIAGAAFEAAHVLVGGYFSAATSDGHATELPVVADLDGDGVNEIYVPKSNAELARIDVRDGATTSTVIMRTNGVPRLLAIPSDHSLVVGGTNALYQLRKVDSNGTRIWTVPRPPEVSAQVDLNIGHFGPSGALGLVTGGGGSTYPMPVYAFDLASRTRLWRQNEGTYWDGTFAVADFDGDGIDDIVETNNVAKGRILSGLDGGSIVEPSGIPLFHNLNRVDYNGAPIVFDANGDGLPEVLIAEDNAHMLMLRVSVARRQSSILWSREQAVLDDERWSMAAVAPMPNSAPMIGVGTLRGVLVGVDASGGGVRWETALTDPDWHFGTNAVSSVVAADIDGVNGLEFLAGTESGRLFAVQASTGAILWSLDLGEAIGDPIVADVDGDGISDILVPCADGYLYSISGLRLRSRAVRH